MSVHTTRQGRVIGFQRFCSPLFVGDAHRLRRGRGCSVSFLCCCCCRWAAFAYLCVGFNDVNLPCSYSLHNCFHAYYRQLCDWVTIVLTRLQGNCNMISGHQKWSEWSYSKVLRKWLFIHSVLSNQPTVETGDNNVDKMMMCLLSPHSNTYFLILSEKNNTW